MEKQKRWQYYLILAVIILTLYNILPTIIFYSKPLKAPIDAPRAEQVAESIVARVNSMEEDSKEWLSSFSKLLGVKPTSIQLENDPGLFKVVFSNPKDAAIFKRFLPRAGDLIPFVPAQLNLAPEMADADPNSVLVARQIGIHLNPDEINQLFHFSPKYSSDGTLEPLYRDIVYDRVVQLAKGFAGQSRTAQLLASINDNPSDPQYNQVVLALAKELNDVDVALGKNSALAKRYFAQFAQSSSPQSDVLMKSFTARAEALKTSIVSQKDALQEDIKKAKAAGQSIDGSQEQQLSLLENQRRTLDSAITLVQKNAELFKSQAPLSEEAIRKTLAATETKVDANTKLQVVKLDGHNPFIEALVIDWNSDKIRLQFYPEVDNIRLSDGKTETAAFLKDRVNLWVINDIARVSRIADENIAPDSDQFAVTLNTLTNSQSLLTLDLGQVAAKLNNQLLDQLQHSWMPKHSDLSSEAYPIMTYDAFKKLKPEDQKLGLVIYAPAMYKEAPPAGFRTGSIYVIARGMDSIQQKYRQNPGSDEKQFNADANQLQTILQQKNFIGYPGSSYGIDPAFRKDYIFELNDYYSNILKASREDFIVKGSKRFAALDFTDVEQRILATNKIDDQIQEDLLKWKEEYSAAQVDMNATSKYLVPEPTKNPYWSNFKLSFAKYFRGDERKVLKWGLDLSGGKTVRIGLRDHSGRPVTNPDDLRQAVNELYTRVNNMGVSERTIHVEGNNIILDFPGSQNISAAELIKASAMYFHIVNEKFSPGNAALRDPLNQFLQEVWNEAVVTNRKDAESINAIAWQHLGGDTTMQDMALHPRTDYAKTLYDNGLRLANPKDTTSSSAFNDTLSSIAVMRGDDFSEWDGQAHPLVVIFRNYALEGSSLSNVQVGYDPSQGNILTFGIKSSYEGADRGGSPRDDFYAWTSQFSEDKIAGTPKEEFTHGRGWRMAVILNDQVITRPSLHAALRDGATISGRFSQREINQLAADLKAGSLSFTPRILSEENVSPELGKEERKDGIIASLVALALVVIAMVGYYHFAGIVASCAVLFNILIMWGVLQNLGAALTLPGIAGIVLTIGMAVDANVLVFERIREEFNVSGRIASAIQAGYRKAFSAIADSNITTIMAALILLQFDSGPIKSFAVMLIIGIVSSMFTALFMTRYFFAGWVQNPEHKSLKMSQFIGRTHIDFLKYAKPVIAASLIVMAIGTYFFVTQRNSLFGMDFTGGYSLNVEVQERPDHPSYRVEAINALLAHGVTTNDVQVRELTRPNQLRIQLGMGMEEKGHPFYQMPERLTEGKFNYDYQQNPRMAWVVNALNDANLKVIPSQLPQLHDNWTVISGQLSDTMRNNALLGLGLALLCILIYIAIRFEFKFALSAVIGLVHDVLITLGILAIFYAMGLHVQIDLQVIGALMTIIGYSLNDTIIVFDRIREDLHIMRKMPYKDIINHALNVTLSRTIMTSGTTLLVLLALVLLGGKSIFSFSLVMTIGVLVGTASSLFIATPVLLYLHNREVEK
jgi:SecD/SecF fusion protein